MGYQGQFTDALGEGYGFRKVRAAPRRDGIWRQRDRLPAALRRAEPLPTTPRTSSTSSTAAPPRSSSTATSTPSGKAASCTSSRRRTAAFRTAPTTSSCLVIVGGRAATCSATASSSVPKISRSGRAVGMNGLMMDVQLTLPILLAPPSSTTPRRRSSTRLPEPELPPDDARPEVARRARALAVAIQNLGLERGAGSRRSAGTTTSHPRGLLSASRAAASVLHTLNLRLHPTTSPTSGGRRERSRR